MQITKSRQMATQVRQSHCGGHFHAMCYAVAVDHYSDDFILFFLNSALVLNPDPTGFPILVIQETYYLPKQYRPKQTLCEGRRDTGILLLLLLSFQCRAAFSAA